MSETCADCGTKVVRIRLHPAGWAEELGDGTYSTVCRARTGNGRLISADYHYVEGETQRHFPKEEA